MTQTSSSTTLSIIETTMAAHSVTRWWGSPKEPTRARCACGWEDMVRNHDFSSARRHIATAIDEALSRQH